MQIFDVLNEMQRVKLLWSAKFRAVRYAEFA